MLDSYNQVYIKYTDDEEDMWLTFKE
jgi:hypothetical protein